MMGDTVGGLLEVKACRAHQRRVLLNICQERWPKFYGKILFSSSAECILLGMLVAYHE